jgi:hypothetical protein
LLNWLTYRMDAFSYVLGFTTVVLTLGVARLLVGVGRLLEKRGQTRLYWVHLVWVVKVFLFLALEWWILFRWQQKQSGVKLIKISTEFFMREFLLTASL